ncbi:MAG: thrombospondin type 3 repeat-containing protein [Actinomycetota bacterium]|nr:thrombospondin type 3 repeat-containing protein [Actinomycetota bacterium]
MNTRHALGATFPRRSAAFGLSFALLAGLLPFVVPTVATARTAEDASPLGVARETEPVVLTGAHFGEWAVPADTTAKVPTVDGARCEASKEGAPEPIGSEEACTHNAYEDPEVSSSTATNAAGLSGVPVQRLLGYRWDGDSFEQIPFQVDEMFVRYLSNNNSGFSFYSETDQHTSYAFDREGFRWTQDYGAERPGDPLAPCIAKPDSDVAEDPLAGLDSDDELVFMARDARGRATANAPLPQGIEDSFEVEVVDPLTGARQYIYVMRAAEGGPAPEFDASNGYVRYQRDDPEDRNLLLFSQSSFENYGAAPRGPWYDPATGTCHSAEADWKQRRPSDKATITTPRYRFRYDGRWLMTALEVSGHPDGNWEYGPDLIDQWKARAFQQRPGGQTPCCGFEEEVNNWGGSSILMGERSGPVRTIRETWGADSGTNVVRREIFYRDEIRFGAFLRVHVIPPLDGIYSQWDYNFAEVTTYYNPFNPDGVAIDGKNDERFGNSRVHVGPDGVSYDGDDDVSDALDDATGSDTQGVGATNEPSCKPVDEHAPYYEQLPRQIRDELEDACIYNDIDSPDPTFSGVNAGLNWEQIAGPNGSLVLRSAIKQFTPGSAQALLAAPYYRDDACFDDGTGSDPGPHLNQRGVDEATSPYDVYTDTDGVTYSRECFDSSNPEHVSDLGTSYLCTEKVVDPVASDNESTRFKNITAEIPGCRFFQGSIGTHGVHILAIAESDNAGTTVPLTEIDTEQRAVILPGDPGNVGDTYGRHSEKPLVAHTTPEQRDQAPAESPSPMPSTTSSASPTPTSSGSPSDPDPAISTNAGCDPIDPTECLLPFPNDLFTVADETTDTGRRVNFNPLAMPRTGTEITDGGEGKPVDPTEWNRNDGFSPGSPVMTYVPGIDLHATWGTQDRKRAGTPNDPSYFDHRDHIADIGLYADPDAPIVIINADTGERHPIWSELDTHPDAVRASRQTLIMRPAVNFDEGQRYVVGLRDLRRADGTVIAARPPFASYRDRTGSDTQRQAYFNSNVFPVLESAGIARDDLYLAWDFTVASEQNLAERILHMRNEAFAGLKDMSMGDRRIQGAAPDFTIDATSEFNDSWTDSRGVTHTRLYRRIEGRVTVPNFMDRIQQTESKVKGTGEIPDWPRPHEDFPGNPVDGVQYDVPAPGSRLLDLNRDGLPDQNPVEPTVNVYFVCEVPLNGEPNVPGLYGHGLLGQARDQIQDFRRSPGRMTSMFGCAADWWGMATQDLPTVLAATTDMSHFPTIPDRAQQGFLNFMFLGRAAAHPDGFANDPTFQQDGESLVKASPINEETELVYDGNSQGGIMGGSLVAVSPDINRAILGVPGMNYSTLLNRSVDFEGEFQLEPDLPPYSFPVYQSYRDVVERQVLFGLMQMLWDRGEANGYAHHMTSDPLPDTPVHDVMLQVAWSDHQVANVSAEVEARTIGAPIMDPGLPHDAGDGQHQHWEMVPYFGPTATYPHDGSALVYWDSGNARPPNGNIPPTDNGDPHGHPRNEPAAGWQEAHFLLTGEMIDVCQGGDYLTRRHPANGGTPSCHEPDFEPGQQPPAGDADGDGVADDVDNCPDAANPGQEDSDRDGVGDACDDDIIPPADRDNDGVPDASDNCPDHANPNQENTYGDERGDACEPNPTPTSTDDQTADPKPTPEPTGTASPSPTATSADADGDGVSDDRDNCPNHANPGQENTYGDARGDACESPPQSGGGGGGGSGGGSTTSPSPEPTSTQASDDIGDISTTIAADRSKVRFRRPFTLSGSIDAPRDCGGPFQVELSRRLAGANSFKLIATLDVSDDMTWTYTARGRKNASYIAKARSVGGCEGQSSAPTDVLVRAKLIAKVPARCRGRITGRLLPARDEGRVSLQRRRQGEWVKVRSGRLGDNSRFRIRAPRCGTFRLVWKSDGLNLRTAKRITLGR